MRLFSTAGRWLVVTIAYAIGMQTILVPLGAQETNQPGTKSGDRSIDQQLLDDLNRQPHKGSTEADKAKSRPPRQSPDEDLGQPKSNDAWRSEIARKMRHAQELLQSDATASNAPGVQQAIADDLQQLIDQLDQRRRSEAQARQKQQTSQPNQANGQDPSNGEPQGAGNRKPGEAFPRRDEIDQWSQRVWGVLPDQVQQRMQNLANEQFLPAYEKVIQQYYEKLSERSSPR